MTATTPERASSFSLDIDKRTIKTSIS